MDNYQGSLAVSSIEKYLHGLGMEITADNNSLYISLLSDTAVKSLSHGKVNLPETINFRTNAPIRGGLFSQSIFGPVRNYECECGKYKRIKYKDMVCDRCNVEVTSSNVRFEREGHIDLAVPMLNPLFAEHLAGYLGMGKEELRKAMYYDTDLSESKNLVERISQIKGKEKYMIMSKMIVIPPNLRPFVNLGDGRYAKADTNDLYMQLVNRNIRVLNLMERKSPEVILRNEFRMLQESVDRLFMNEAIGNWTQLKYRNGNPLRSISGDLIKVLESFFDRGQDFSGRAVATFNPLLGQGKCELPEQALLTLYDPVIIHHLKISGAAYTVRSSRKLIESVINGETENREKVIPALNEAIKSRPIILMHDSTATAVYPSVGNSESIGLCAVECTGLGLKLNGERVKFYLPLTMGAVSEARAMVGSFNKGEGKVDSAFSDLAKLGLEGITKLAISGDKIPLREIDRILLN